MTAEANTFLKVLSWLFLCVGVIFALYYFFTDSWQDFTAHQQAIAANRNSWGYVPMPAIDRLIGVVFGLGIAFLGMFGLSILKRDEGH